MLIDSRGNNFEIPCNLNVDDVQTDILNQVALVENDVHNNVSSDAAETAAFEIGLWFEASELNDWSPSDQEWRVEG